MSLSLIDYALSLIQKSECDGLVIVFSRGETVATVNALLPVGVPVVWSATTDEAFQALAGDATVFVPRVMDRVQVFSYVIVHAIVQEKVDPSLRMLCLSEGERGFDLLQTITPKTDLELANIASWTADRGINPNALLAVLALAIDLGGDRTGRAAGTLFTIGDAEAVLARAEPYPFEPFASCPVELRQIIDSSTQVAIQKYARVDGVFVIAGDGTIERFIKSINPRQRSPYLDTSLGSRHTAAAGITIETRALSILVTESGGNVKLFKDGAIILTYKPR